MFKEHFLFIDGQNIEGISVGENYLNPSHSYNYYVIAWDKESSNEIVSQKLNEFILAGVGLLTLNHWTYWEGFDISVSFKKDIKTQEILFETEFNPDLVNWKSLYSFNDYYQKFSEIWNIKYQEKSLDERKENRFKPTLKALLGDLIIVDEIKYNLERIFIIHHEALEKLGVEDFENRVITYFNFPEEIKVPCEQYLLYFAQFLRDLGINATPNLKEEAGKVLFSVTPDDDIEALDKIREALEVYLRLPSSPITSNSLEIAIQRLESQVEYFRSQICLARAENQLKEATIQQQQVTIMKLGENVMIDSMVKSVSKNKTSEKVVDGIEVGKIEALEKYGTIIDLGELFRTMKGWFKK